MAPAPLIVVFGSSLPSTKIKIVVKVGPPLTKLPGSTHDNIQLYLNIILLVSLKMENGLSKCEIICRSRMGFTLNIATK